VVSGSGLYAYDTRNRPDGDRHDQHEREAASGSGHALARIRWLF
jgi:hypothetical protein